MSAVKGADRGLADRGLADMGMVESFIVWLGPWAWFLGGLVLLGLEILAPGTFFLWFGVSALAVGVLQLVFPIHWQAALIVWVVLALALLLVGRRYFHRAGTSEDPTLNDRAGRYLGHAFTLTAPIIEGSGTVKLDDTIWRITGPDLPAGTKVRVAAAQGTVLRIEKQGD